MAEIALVVADHMHHRGVGTLLLEHLAFGALRQGVRAFRGDTLAQNTEMLGVFTDAGLRVRQRAFAGVVEVTMPLDTDDRYLDAVAERERHADVESLETVLRPGVIAAVGASRRSGSVGQTILRNICSAGFGGAVYAVNPRGGPRAASVPCAHSVANLPEPPELAVVTVPAPTGAVPAQPGHRGRGRRGGRRPGGRRPHRAQRSRRRGRQDRQAHRRHRPRPNGDGDHTSERSGGGGLPSYAFPEDAAQAFAHAWSYGRWLTRPPGTLPRHVDLRPDKAGTIVGDFLGRHPGGGFVPWRWARSEDEVVHAAAELGGHVALKADVPGVGAQDRSRCAPP